MNLVLSGGREWASYRDEDNGLGLSLDSNLVEPTLEAINIFLSNNSQIEEIHVGDCPTGLDYIARTYYDCNVHQANWKDLGKSAGPVRNQHMINLGDILLAFPLGESKGTWDCIRRGVTKGIAVYIGNEKGEISRYEAK